MIKRIFLTASNWLLRPRRSAARHCLQKHTKHSRVFKAATALLSTTLAVSTTAQLQLHTFPMYALRKHFFPRLHFVRCFVVVNVLHSFTQTPHIHTHAHVKGAQNTPSFLPRFSRLLRTFRPLLLLVFCRYHWELLMLLLFYLFSLQLFFFAAAAYHWKFFHLLALVLNSIFITNFLPFAIYICTFMSHFTLSLHLFWICAGGWGAMLKKMLGFQFTNTRHTRTN